MGLLDKLVKNKISDKISETLSSAVTNAVNKAEELSGVDLDGDGKKGSARLYSTTTSSAPSAKVATDSQAISAPSQKGKEYFAEILATEFSSYEIRENVNPAAFGGSGRNLDFVLHSGGNLLGAVVLVDHNRDNNKAYKDAKSSCEKAGVAFINFYTHMPNERDFVIYRIKNKL
ncbi:MAG: hypothetical protein LBQ95_05610 [Lachnospiraceae bacterium]|nr:hypothetical protein [Lachnospiraceae bacterium]